ncbi:MAG: uracil-DNA glycosylase family protein [Halobacteriaceae archaeon]
MSNGDDVPSAAGCERCAALVDARSQVVDGTGRPDADLAFVGEAPGQSEDEQGEPFVGRSGDVLDDALADAGLTRDAVWITNCVRCRPPDNRDPTSAELSNCRGHLDRELAAVDPELVVALGKVPAEHLLDREVAVTAAAGATETVEIGGTAREVLVCVHPAATLYDPAQRETFAATVRDAVDRADVAGDQRQLGDF